MGFERPRKKKLEGLKQTDKETEEQLNKEFKGELKKIRDFGNTAIENIQENLLYFVNPEKRPHTRMGKIFSPEYHIAIEKERKEKVNSIRIKLLLRLKISRRNAEKLANLLFDHKRGEVESDKNIQKYIDKIKNATKLEELLDTQDELNIEKLSIENRVEELIKHLKKIEEKELINSIKNKLLLELKISSRNAEKLANLLFDHKRGEVESDKNIQKYIDKIKNATKLKDLGIEYVETEEKKETETKETESKTQTETKTEKTESETEKEETETKEGDDIKAWSMDKKVEALIKDLEKLNPYNVL